MKTLLVVLILFCLPLTLFANDISDAEIDQAMDTFIADQNDEAFDLILPGGLTLITGTGVIRYNRKINKMNSRLDDLDELAKLKENATLRGKPAPLSTRSVDHLHGNITNRLTKTEIKNSLLKKLAWLSLGYTVVQGVDLILTKNEIDELVEQYPELLDGEPSPALENDIINTMVSGEL